LLEIHEIASGTGKTGKEPDHLQTKTWLFFELDAHLTMIILRCKLVVLAGFQMICSPQPELFGLLHQWLPKTRSTVPSPA